MTEVPESDVEEILLLKVDQSEAARHPKVDELEVAHDRALATFTRPEPSNEVKREPFRVRAVATFRFEVVALVPVALTKVREAMVLFPEK